MKREASPLSISSLEHAERVHIGFEQRLLLLALVAVLLAQADNDTQCLDVKAVALGLGIDIANVVGDRFFLFLEPLDPLDKGFELILGKTAGGLIVFDPLDTPWRGSRNPPPAFEAAPLAVKPRARSSTALHRRTAPRSGRQCFSLAFSNAAFCSAEASFWCLARHSS